VHLVTCGHFWSRDKEGSHDIRSATAVNPMLHTNCTSVLCYRTGVIANGSFTKQEFNLFAHVTLTLPRWPSYTNSTRFT